MSAAEVSVGRILTENVLTLTQARTAIEEITGLRPDKATITRWIHRGIGGTRLEAVRIGRNLLTSTEALTRFFVARTKTIGE